MSDTAVMAEATRERAARLDYPWDARALDWPDLPPGATVIEVGGYTGRWALQMAERYAPRLIVFEPQPWAADVCRAVLGERATVLGYGLGTATGQALMGAWGTDGGSFVKDGIEPAWLREAGVALHDLQIARIDLMLMNIEGYEYALLPHMIDRGILPDRLMVQFHTFRDPSGVATARIFEELDRVGYRIRWTYGPCLTAWGRA